MDIFDSAKYLKVIQSELEQLEKIITVAQNEIMCEKESCLSVTQTEQQTIIDAWKQFMDSELNPIKNDLNKIQSVLAELHPILPSRTKTPLFSSHGKKDDSVKSYLYSLLSKLNHITAWLNVYDHAELYPTLKISHSVHVDQEFTVNFGKNKISFNFKSIAPKRNTFILHNQLYNEHLVKAWAYATHALQVVDDLEKRANDSSIKPDMTLYREYSQKQMVKWIESYTDKKNQSIDKQFKDKLCSGKGRITHEKISLLQESSPGKAIDFSSGTNEFPQFLKLGQVQITLTESSVCSALAAKSPLLKNLIKKGRATIPWVLDLSSRGSIIYNISVKKHTKEIITFIDQCIIGFLLSFPAVRINLCLIDPDSFCEFSRYASLKMINPNLLQTHYDPRKLNDVLLEYYNTMHRIQEDKISASGCRDFFEYNRRASSNPQSAHLLVITNFPKAFRNETAEVLQKLIISGWKAGIFTLLVNNSLCELDSGYKPEQYSEFKSSVHNHAYIINHTKATGNTLEGIPFNSLLPPVGFQQADIPKYIDIIKKNSKKSMEVIVTLQSMFTISKKHEDEGSVLPAAEVLSIPLGASGDAIISLDLDTTGSGSPYAFIIGSPGFGKSYLLHAIILSSCFRYGPKDLNIYLADFKGGNSFEYYSMGGATEKQLPHIKLIGLTSEPADGLAILRNLEKELGRRESLFKKSSCESIIEYNNMASAKLLPPCPRLLVIIDELQVVLENDDKIAVKAIEILGNLCKKSRSLGISLVLASQNVPRVPGLKDKILSQIGNRICLRLNECEESEALGIPQKLSQALISPELGKAILKTNLGMIEFRVAFCDKGKIRDAYTANILSKWLAEKKMLENFMPMYIIGDEVLPDPFEKGTYYHQVLKRGGRSEIEANTVHLWLGRDFISGSPYSLQIRLYDTNQNVWIAGRDSAMLRDILAYSLLSYTMSKTSAKEILPVYFANTDFTFTSSDSDLLIKIVSALPEHIQDVSARDKFIKTLVKLNKVRIERSSSLGKTTEYRMPNPVFLFINRLQGYQDLFSDETLIALEEEESPPATKSEKPLPSVFNPDFEASDFLSKSPSVTKSKKASFSSIFLDVFSKGPEVGIHIITTVNDPNAILLLRSAMRDCIGRVALKGLADYKIASDSMAVYVTADGLESFTPYRYDPKRDDKWIEQIVNNVKSTK